MRLNTTLLLRVFPFVLILLSAAEMLAQPASFYRVYFDYAKHSLTEEASATIDAEVAKLDLSQRYRVSLIGHTDQRGNLDYNQELSNKRALRVKEALTAYGFNELDIKVEGLAYLDPLSQDTSEVAMARNRRVEVIVEKADWNVESTYMLVPSAQPSELTYERSGTKIKIPAHAFTYQDGTPVEGEVLVQYREFRDPADFIVSRIPMQLEHDGAPGYFNSTGMFEVRAYDQAGTSLQLQDDKELTLDFVQTQLAEGTQFWYYNEDKKNWEDGNEKARFEDPSTKEVAIDKEMEQLGELLLQWPTQEYWQKYPDTFKQLQQAYELVERLLSPQLSGAEPYIPELDYKGFEQRFKYERNNGYYAGTEFVYHRNFRQSYSKIKYYNLRLRGRWGRKGRTYYSLDDRTGVNKELSTFDGFFWKIRKRDIRKMRKSIKGFKFADARLVYNSRSASYPFILRVKQKGKIYDLHANLLSKDREKVTADSARVLYQRYQRTLFQRSETFNRQLTSQDKQAELIWPCVKLLLPKEVINNAQHAIGMRFALGEDGQNKYAWPSDFSNLNVNAATDTYWNPTSIDGFGFLITYGRFFKEELTEKDQPDWRELIQNYQKEVFVTKAEFATAQRAFENPTSKFRLAGLGVFNCDVLKRFKEKYRLMVKLQDEEGKPLSFKRIEVVNHNLNGLLSFDTRKVYLDLSAQNSILVYTRDGHIRYVPRNEVEKFSKDKKRNYVFTTIDAGKFTGDPKQIRGLLGAS